MKSVVMKTDIGDLRCLSRGKVRDIYEFEDKLLLVATDRISAFDVVFPNGIPNKGSVLTQLSAFWFARTKNIVDNHCVTAEFDSFPRSLQDDQVLSGRSMLVRRCEVLPIECIVRGYLEGSAWKEYQQSGSVTGISLPAGLKRRSRLPEPIFTPSTKAETGHDENITFDRMVNLVGLEASETVREYSLKLYDFAHAYLEKREITIADTKFEFGYLNGQLILIDEVLTPDSSRFWVKGALSPQGEPISYDKQYVRDYLETQDWDKNPPAPALPDDVVESTSKRYLEIRDKIMSE